jgi:hypothetical protein
VDVVDGKVPIAKVKHPTRSGNWGLYAKWDGIGFTFEFKEVPQAWYQAMWSWLVELVGAIVDTFGALLGALRGALCVAARSHMDQILAFTSYGKPISADDREKLAAKGITAAELDAISQTKTDVTTNVANAIANKLTAGFCPPDAPVGPQTQIIKPPFYKQPLFWGAASLVAVLGIGAKVYLSR